MIIKSVDDLFCLYNFSEDSKLDVIQLCNNNKEYFLLRINSACFRLHKTQQDSYTLKF